MNFQLLIWTLILHIQLSESIFVDEFQIKEIPTINEWFACDSQQPLLVANSYGYLVSINFTTSKFVPYPDGLNCSWVLLAPADKVIFLTVQNLDLEKDRRILIYDGFDEISKLGAIFSRSRANNYRSTGNSVFIRFEGRNKTKEGEIALFTGFKIYFEHRKKPKQCLTSQKRCKNGYECIEKKSVCDTVFDCDDGSDEENCGSISSEFPQSCGNPAITPRLSLFKIVGGTVAKPGSWPWQVSLRVIYREPDGNLCGASIINRDWVLTAAHCFDEYNDKRMWTLSFAKFHKMIVDETQFTRYISKLIVHPKYNATKKQNDIALVKLNAQLPTDNDLVAPICLPEKGDEEGETAGTTAYAIGWGETYGDPLYSNVLKQTALPIVTDNECKLSNPWLDINSVLCAGYELGGKDTCKGDSGGPLMWFSKRSKKWVLLGITSFGAFFCGTPNDPGVYTKVSNYIQWIQNTTKYE